MMAFCPEHLKWDQNPKFTPLSETTSIPAPFIWEFPPPGIIRTFDTFDNYWVRMSVIWTIKQIEGNLGQGYGFLPSWITASEFSRSAKAILHIIQNPPEFNNCFIIHSKYFEVLNNLTSSSVDFPQTFACFLARPVCMIVLFHFRGYEK